MPELPETETIARDLDATVRGARIRSVEVLRGDVLRDPTRGGRALRGSRRTRLVAVFEQAVAGKTISGVTRRAKSVVVQLRDDTRLVVTPRFTGALLVDQPRDAYACIAFTLSDGRTLTYRDVRRLGTVGHYDAEQFVAFDAALGPEPLDPQLTAERFSGILRGSERAVKSVLMDQRKLAGVGNIYANEACWRARIAPRRAANRVSASEARALLQELRGVLSESIAARGTTFRDYRDAYGNRGGFAAALKVYGRGGAPCLRCGTKLRETHAIEKRSTVWCPRCQA